MSNALKYTVTKHKLSALERVLLKKMKRSKKSCWMLDPADNR
ncbi:MAG: hypothetical protein WBF77_10595 [Sulfurimonadaceae bacterium]